MKKTWHERGQGLSDTLKRTLRAVWTSRFMHDDKGHAMIRRAIKNIRTVEAW